MILDGYRGHRDNQGLGGIVEITDPTKNLHRPSRSTRQLGSWTDIGEHRDKQDHGGILDIIDQNKVLDGSSRSSRQLGSWTDLRDRRDN